MTAFDLLPPAMPAEQERAALAALGIISAALYATGLALGAESLARTSFWLLYAEEDRYRLLARNMTDVITRHGRNGAVLFVSPAAEPLFGATVRDLLGHGLFDRVHVADRPAYLTALARFGGARREPLGRVPRAPRWRRGSRSTRVHLGRDALPRARPGVGETWPPRARGRRRHARHHRAQGAGAGARRGARARPSAPMPPRAASSPP